MTTARPRIDQLVAGFVAGDAITREAQHLQAVFRSLGHASDIFAPAARISPDAGGACRPLSELQAGSHDLLLAHHATGSAITARFLAHPGRKLLRYHNITPAEFFDGFDDSIAAELRRGREALPAVLAAADVVWAVSEYNAAELRALTDKPVRVFALPFAPAELDQPPDPRVAAKFATRMINILFVGRLAPNKCIEELIEAFAWYNRGLNPFSRLILVGSDRTAPRYCTMLRMLVGDLGLTTVCFEDFASDRGLSAYYAAADLFVTTSRHEGYCLPLVEAMHKGVPIIARATGGMPEAMDGAGVLFDDLTPAELAALMHRVLCDAPLREAVLDSQRRRMAAVRARDVIADVRALLQE
ncbi:MAG: glycosyltransferase [Lentisphaerae bacterium]|nr:glycosyltransferase [Lentisphaerota bacterium]